MAIYFKYTDFLFCGEIETRYNSNIGDIILTLEIKPNTNKENWRTQESIYDSEVSNELVNTL